MFKLFSTKANKVKRLEEEVTQDGFFYIKDTVFNPTENKISIIFINNPDGGSSERVLHFINVEDLSDEILSEDFEDGDIDSLIGLDEYSENDFVKYVVHSELREMIFRTKEKPRLMIS